jgi:hypothetical protein
MLKRKKLRSALVGLGVYNNLKKALRKGKNLRVKNSPKPDRE